MWLRILLGLCILCILSGVYGFFKKPKSSEYPNYLNAYSFDEFIKHYQQHIKLLQTVKNIPILVLLALTLLPIVVTTRLLNFFIFIITFIKFWIKYIKNDNLIIFPKAKLRINPCITTSEFLYQIFFVIPSAGGFRCFYTTASLLAKKTQISKESWTKKFSILLLNTILGISFWNMAASFVLASETIQTFQTYRAKNMFAALRYQWIICIHTKLNLSVAFVSQLRIYNKHGARVFNPKDPLIHNLHLLSLVRCFSTERLQHFGLTIGTENKENTILNLFTHKTLPNVISWQVDFSTRPTYATSNAIFSGHIQATALNAAPQLQHLSFTDYNLRWFFFKIATLEQLTKPGVVIKLDGKNVYIPNTNRYFYAQQHTAKFSTASLEFEEMLHLKLSQLGQTSRQQLRVELQQVQHNGLNTMPQSLLNALEKWNLVEFYLDDLLH